MASQVRLGLFGGTFDPPHIGHLIVAQDVHDALGLDRVIFIPAAVPPHKADEGVSPPALRLEMIRAAVADDDRFRVSDVELRREGPSYTVDTLEELRSRDPGAFVYFIVGADQFRSFHTWREPEAVARLARLAVMTRSGWSPDRDAPPIDVEYEAVPVTRVDLSSTDIRRRIREGRSVRYMVPGPVLRIIERERLYLEPAGAPHSV
jgi:nicotinate-nucleotide adenylyltransferase